VNETNDQIEIKKSMTTIKKMERISQWGLVKATFSFEVLYSVALNVVMICWTAGVWDAHYSSLFFFIFNLDLELK
jgi:hypothetical protein